jgi:hypothetical protein
MAKMRRTALYFESCKSTHVHALTVLVASHPEIQSAISYYHLLAGRLAHAEATLKPLLQKRQELQNKADALAKSTEGVPTKKCVISDMEIYAQDIAIKDVQIAEMMAQIHAHHSETQDSVTNCRGARLRLSHRRERFFDLKRRSEETERSSPFCTEQNPLYLSQPPAGGGFVFTPRPPAQPSHRGVLHLDVSPMSPRFPAPQSQRSRRPNLIELRRKLTRPIQTARKNP